MTTYTLIRLTLAIETRWSVGRVPDPDESADLAMTVDPRGRGSRGYTPYVPGSSLAGALRRHLGDRAAYWLGDPPPAWEDAEDEDAPRERRASRLSILGILPVDAAVEETGATSVDGARGAALGKGLRQTQWAGPTEIVVCFEHAGDRDSGLVGELASWAPIVGRGRSTGMGCARTTHVQTVTVDLARPEHLTWWMTQRRDWYEGATPTPAGVANHVAASPETLNSTLGTSNASERTESVPALAPLRWRVREPIHVGVGDPPLGAQAPLPMMRLNGAALIPGSTWKGLFRHRIAAILSVLEGGSETSSEIESALFGDTTDGRGLLRFSDSVAATDARTIVRSHVAIDRFTGGARDGALYRVEALDRGAEFDLVIGYVAGLGAPPTALENLLHHVVRDLHEGYVSVGGMGTRGYGMVELVDASVVQGCRGISVPDVLDAIRAVRRAPAVSAQSEEIGAP